jgi:glycosyltransferase involved in cell wall biosynthesis
LSELRRRGHDVRLRFVGTHFPQARRQLDDQAARDGVASYVDYLGQVDEERLQDLYASSLLLAPSTHEGLGLGPIEALLAGGRVVCGTAPVFRETVGDLASYADPQDPADLADACERACATTLPEQELAALAKRFSSAACASAAVAAFERLRSSPAK